MRTEAKIAILAALRSGEYFETLWDDVDIAVLPADRRTCVGGVIYHTYKKTASPPYRQRESDYPLKGFQFWMGMNHYELDAFAEWSECLFRRTRSFTVCADAIEKFYPEPRHRNLTMDEILAKVGEGYEFVRDDDGKYIDAFPPFHLKNDPGAVVLRIQIAKDLAVTANRAIVTGLQNNPCGEIVLEKPK